MAAIDIGGLSEVELLELYERIYDRLRSWNPNMRGRPWRITGRVCG